jgi:hypothetical protein
MLLKVPSQKDMHEGKVSNHSQVWLQYQTQLGGGIWVFSQKSGTARMQLGVYDPQQT